MKNKAGDNLYPCPYFPVGSIFITAVNTNPSQWFGGTWEAFAQGRTLVGVNPNETEFNTVLKTGGSKELQKHSHTCSTNGGHSHRNQWDGFSINSGNQFKWVVINGGSNQGVDTSWDGDHSHTIGETGTGNSGNLQPYITVYFWRRIA